MIMKKIGFLLLLICGSALSASQPFKFSGELIKGSCSVKQTVEVSLGKIDISRMRSAGHSQDTPFNISFYDCDTQLSLAVSMRFTADTYSGIPDKIKPAVSPGDSKYVIGVYFNNNPVSLNTDFSSIFGYSEKKGSFDIPFTARLEVTDANTITTGNVEGSLFFEVEYN